MRLSFFSVLPATFSLCAAEFISLDHLPQEVIHKNRKEVVVEGFLYKSSENQWVLAKEPHLSSCCVGTKAKISNQLYIIGSKDSFVENEKISLKGIFGRDKDTDKEFFTLRDPVILESPHKIFPFFSVTAALLAFLGIVYKIRDKGNNKDNRDKGFRKIDK
jgi:hypothetical protein